MKVACALAMAALALSCTAVAAAPGADVYQAHCARCHGEAADGRSRLAQVLQTKPANLRASRLTRAQQERMVRLGGEANGRAALMPAWQGQLSDDEIQRVLDFLASVRTVR